MTTNSNLIVLLELAERSRRSWWVWFAVVSLGLSLGIFALHVLPKIYEAKTTILVAPPRFPEQYVRTHRTGDMATRIASLRESVISRPYLERVASEIYGYDPKSVMTERLIDVIRRRLEITIEHFDQRRGTGLFVLRYRDEDPKKVAAVVNALADSYIDANVRLRLNDAQQTYATLAALAEEVLVQIEEKERDIVSFKAAHLYELESHLQPNLELLRSRQTDLEEISRALEAAEGRLEIMDLQLRSGSASASSAPGSRREETHEEMLARLERELAQLELRYTDLHPAVKAKRAEILQAGRLAATPESASSESGGTGGSQPVHENVLLLRKEAQRLRAEQERCRADIDLYRSRIEATPRAEQQLKELTKGYETLTNKYEEYQNNMENARAAMRLEEHRQGEQFEVVERAVPPAIPVQPRQELVMLASLGFAFIVPISFLGTPMVVRPRIESLARLQSCSEVPVLATIDRIGTRATRRHRITRLVANVALASASMALLWFTLTVVR